MVLQEGDVVRLRSDLRPGQSFPYGYGIVTFVSTMEKFIGKEVTVRRVHQFVSSMFRIEEDRYHWYHADMVECHVDDLDDNAEINCHELLCLIEGE